MTRKKKILSRRSLFIIAFLLPAVFLFAVIYAYPLVNMIVTSFCEWNSKNFVAPEFLVWDHMFDNYIKMFTLDKNFQMALINSLKWVALTLVIQVPWAVLVALVLSKKERGWRFTRNMFVIPNIISTAAIGLIFLNLYRSFWYNKNLGIRMRVVNEFSQRAFFILLDFQGNVREIPILAAQKKFASVPWENEHFPCRVL